MKDIFTDLKVVAFSFIFFVLGFLIYSKFLVKSDRNFVNNKSINLGIGWKNNESNYGGSELGFVFNKSDHISFSFKSASHADQGVEILVDKTPYVIQSPSISSQTLTVIVDKNESHNVSVKHFCTQFNYPCTINLHGIYLSNSAEVWPAQPHGKVLSILGDSISTIYGKDNYSYLLSTDLGYELHDASTVGETVSKVKGYRNTIDAVDQDILPFKSDITLIFLGTNDVENNVSPVQFEKDYSTIVAKIKRKTPKIFLVGILLRKDLSNNQIQNYNDIIKKIADKYNATYIDSSSWLSSNDYADDIHPTSEAQQKISDNINKIMAESLK